MKYPQLVSTRAVNAISDWLVSRLEQLGVEAPQIYSRLLLSLLQSSVQINDPIEFCNSEKQVANRKGSNRRYLSCDTDTIKKLNAIQCLRDIVSTEQDIATIENLVDELCEKLKDVEKQTNDTEDEDKLFVSTFSLTTTSTTTTTTTTSSATSRCRLPNNQQTGNEHQHKSNLSNVHVHGHTNNSSNSNNNNNHNHHHNRAERSGEGLAAGDPADGNRGGNSNKAADLETDPKKRYFRAFPALSKEMEDSFRIWRRKTKSWPADRGNISISTSSSSSTISSSLGSNEAVRAKESEDYVKSHDANDCLKSSKHLDEHRENVENAEDKDKGKGKHNEEDDGYNNATSSARVKRKSKRRRNQAMSKGKTIQNMRKTTAVSGGTLSGNGNGNRGDGGRGGRQYRHSSPTYWDTDFEGCWEMGHDLIKEFIMRQNKRQPLNRSTSESAAYQMKDNETTVDSSMAAMGTLQGEMMKKQLNDNEVEVEIEVDECQSPLLMPAVDISFCCDEDYDDTLLSVSEIANDQGMEHVVDGDGDGDGEENRRLYRRDVAIKACELLPPGNQTTDQSDFEEFKAKFNSSVKALWKDVEADADTNTTADATENTVCPLTNDIFSSSLSSMQVQSSLPIIAPFKDELKNFWTNYHNQHVDLSRGNQKQLLYPQQSNAMSGDNCNSLSGSMSGSTLNMDLTNTSDYYSMPSNLEDLEKSVCGMRKDFSGALMGTDLHTSVGLFLQNSIWSENIGTGHGDSDESFYFKVWNSTRKLNELNAAHGGKVTQMDGGKRRENAWQFPPYNASKWSEGINAGPNATQHQYQQEQQQQQEKQHQQQQQQQQLQPLQQQSNFRAQFTSRLAANAENVNIKNLQFDCTDSSTTGSLSATSCSSASYVTSMSISTLSHHWKASQNQEIDVQSWNSSNPLSLTEMYEVEGNSGGIDYEHRVSNTIDVHKPKITLPNHSTTSSGFIEYARLKSEGKIMLRKEPSHQQQDQERERDQNLQNSNQVRTRERSNGSDDENLLTSERTHFHPIKTYADGHTFDIRSSLDVIEYDRSSSGYLYLEANKYLEYTRNDNFMAEEESHNSTAMYGGASSNKCMMNVNDFKIKFRLRNWEVACQTENVDEQPAAIHMRSSSEHMPQMPRQNPFGLLLSDTGSSAKNFTCNSFGGDVFSAVNIRERAHGQTSADAGKAAVVAAAATAVASTFGRNQSSLWTTIEAQHQHTRPRQYQCEHKSKQRHLGPQQQEHLSLAEEDCCDEVDFYSQEKFSYAKKAALNEHWSMHEIGKKCQMAGHGVVSSLNMNNNNNNTSNVNSYNNNENINLNLNNNNNNNNNNINNNNNNNDDDNNSNDASDGHSLWGMCAACNSELKSVPANRLLRDELTLDGDEIMNDLKCMQDLYIGRIEDEESGTSSDSDWEVDDDEDDDGDQGHANAEECIGVDEDEDVVAGRNKNEIENSVILESALDEVAENPKTTPGVGNVAVGESGDMSLANDMQTPQQEMVLQKVNRIIADLLNPEAPPNVSTLSDCHNATSTPTQLGVSLWLGGNVDQNIWQLSAVNSKTLKPMELLRHFNIEPCSSTDNVAPEEGNSSYLSQLNWEHDNLAKIWERATPSLRQSELNSGVAEEEGAEAASLLPPAPPSPPIPLAAPPPLAPPATLCSTNEAPTATVTTSIQNFDVEIGDINLRKMGNLDNATKVELSSSAANYSPKGAVVCVPQQESLSLSLQEVKAPVKPETTARSLAQRRVQQFFTTSGASVQNVASKVRPGNRKRRHSASQNFFHHSSGLSMPSSDNNNDDDIADLNCLNRLITSALVDDIKKYLNSPGQRDGRLNFSKLGNVNDIISDAENSSAYGEGTIRNAESDFVDEGPYFRQAKQTIITCKYWTTIDATMSDDHVSDDIMEGTTALACLLDKNPSILKHVTMVTRPLTR